MRVPFWKFLGKTLLPNLWSRSLFQDIFVLFTVKDWLPRVKVYVSLNKLHAIRPQGTIGLPFAVVFSGSQPLVSFAFFSSRSCASLRLFTYLTWFHKFKWGHQLQQSCRNFPYHLKFSTSNIRYLWVNKKHKFPVGHSKIKLWARD